MRSEFALVRLFTVAIAITSPSGILADQGTYAATPMVGEFAGQPFRFHLGFECTDTADGVMVAAVEPFDSFAFRNHRLKPGNVILSIGGIPLDKAADIREKVLPSLKPFSATMIEVVRAGLTVKEAMIPLGFTAFRQDEGKNLDAPVTWEVPQGLKRKIPTSAAAAQAEGTINVLTKAILDPATGDIEFLGTYDPRFPTGPIPYKDLLKTAIAQPKPWLSLERLNATEDQKSEYRDEVMRRWLAWRKRSEAELLQTGNLWTYPTDDPSQAEAKYAIALLYGNPALAREQQQFVRLASREYGLTTEEFVGVHNFLHAQAQGTVFPDDIVDGVAKALRHTGYGDTAAAWVLYAREAKPEAYREILKQLGHKENELPGTLRLQALFAIFGTYREVSKQSWRSDSLYNDAVTALDAWPRPLPEQWQSMVSAVEKGDIPEALLVSSLERSILPRITEDGERDLVATNVAGIVFSGTLDGFLPRAPRRDFIETNLPRDAQLTRIMYEADMYLKTLDYDQELYAQAHQGFQARWTDIGYRMWWEPQLVPLEVSPDRRVVMFGPVEMAARCEPGKHEPNGPDDAGQRWVASKEGLEVEALLLKYFSTVGRGLDDFAQTRPAFHELREASKILALARWLIQSKVRINLDTIEQTPWIPPAFAPPPYYARVNFYGQGPALAVELLRSGGVDLRDSGWASIVTDEDVEVPMPQALVQSNDLGQSAVAAAIAGDLEQARELAELSAQAMLGPLTDLPAVGMRPVGQPPAEARRPASPSTVRAQGELARLIMREVDGMREGTVSRESGTASLERIQRAYRAIAVDPAGGATVDLRRIASNQPSKTSPQTNRRQSVFSLPLVAVPPVGLTRLGSPVREDGHMNSEEIVFVELSNAFMISMTEVTQKQYRDVMGTSPWSGKSRVRIGDSFPATWVSWHDAIAFCDRLTAQRHATGDLPENERFRLPTEAEWEVACRGGSLFAFCYGNDESRLGKYAWFQGNAMQGTEPFAHQVGTKLPNSWGLFDMHGNVLEWCADWHESSYTGGVNPKGPETGSQRACRGGSWGHAASNCRSACRYALPPDERNEFVGFRVVRAPRE